MLSVFHNFMINSVCYLLFLYNYLYNFLAFSEWKRHHLSTWFSAVNKPIYFEEEERLKKGKKQHENAI